MSNSSNADKKIGIVTLYGNLNHGNKLQNFAVQYLMEERGYSAETLICKKIGLRNVKKYIKRRVNAKKFQREKALAEFSKRHLTVKVVWNKEGILTKENAKDYEYLVVGSDQVWNPQIHIAERDTFLLRFAKRNQRICIAPSLGVEEMPGRYLHDFAVGFQGFPYLSCREKKGTEIIESITGRECKHLLDPTLVIPADTWRSVEEEVKIKDKQYIMLFFLGKIPREAMVLAEKIRENTGAEIIVPSEINDKYFVISPFQFVYLIDHAYCVLTDSFHAAAFAINLNTDFYVYDRNAKKTKEALSEKMNSRILSLTQSTNLCSRYASDEHFRESDNCDFTYANRYLENERSVFHAYLDMCLHQKELAPFSLPENDCTGCGCCEENCPTNSIKMRSDCEGFLYPTIDMEKCINCGKCVKTCHILNQQISKSQMIAYSASNKEPEQLEKSSSGAIFPALAEYVISKGGAVVGACYDGSVNRVIHKIAFTMEEMETLRTSKYIQSSMKEVLHETKELLDNGKIVLFTGTPCQIAGLKSLLNKDYSNLFVCDCACHGVPSPGLWEKWIDEFQHSHDCRVYNVCFRDQSQSDVWGQFKISYKTDGDNLLYEQKDDVFFCAFKTNISLRKSCYNCKYKGWNRNSDITLADFWGVERLCPEGKNARGTSMLLVHTEKGKELLAQIQSQISLHSVDSQLAETVNSATWRSVPQPAQRNAFFSELQYLPVKNCVNKYALQHNPSLLLKMRRKLKRLIGGR